MKNLNLGTLQFLMPFVLWAVRLRLFRGRYFYGGKLLEECLRYSARVEF